MAAVTAAMIGNRPLSLDAETDAALRNTGWYSTPAATVLVGPAEPEAVGAAAAVGEPPAVPAGLVPPVE
jgi:hypothetical protein